MAVAWWGGGGDGPVHCLIHPDGGLQCGYPVGLQRSAPCGGDSGRMGHARYLGLQGGEGWSRAAYTAHRLRDVGAYRRGASAAGGA